ncbi:phage protein [Vibrio splendidus]|uniref:phage protein n=1 Tax=Vibrio splendidus TaxID=29497 RepID=UPI0006CA2A32|nr:phage protein [Vibrio splendidus]KPL99681.1 S-adenosylhomocysteine hydrolase [Vibrio splendidus]
MRTPPFTELVNQHFDSLHDAAAFFHVTVPTIRRWLSGQYPINPIAEKLMNVHARGYLPLDHRWDGFKINVDRATLITPERREFNPKELLSFCYWRDEHRQLVERHGKIESPKYYPPKEHPLPFRGGRRLPAKPWVPSKFK